jgi:uncharacterized protein YkwD
MNLVDAILFLIILLAIYSGYRRGFILGTLELVSWIAGLVIAFWGYKYVAIFVEKIFPKIGVWGDPLSFLITLILARIILGAIVNSILRTTPVQAHQSIVNRLLGMIPGFVNGIIYAAIIATLILVLPLFDGLTAQVRDSKVAGVLTGYVEQVEEKLAPVFNEAVKRTMAKLTIEPESKETIKLPFTVNSDKVREDLEAQMLVMVNEERAKVGLHPLQADPEIQQVARAHSKDMFARGYFSHINPDGKDPFDRIRDAHVRFISAGENLAMARSLRIAHNGLMNSPGHRANILQKSFGRVGIGIIDGGIYGIMITQNFRN